MDKQEAIRKIGEEIDSLKQARSDLIALGWPADADSMIAIDGKIEGLRRAIRIIQQSGE